MKKLPNAIMQVKAYRERIKHREKCYDWTRGNNCINCGYGIGKFYDDLLKEFDIYPNPFEKKSRTRRTT